MKRAIGKFILFCFRIYYILVHRIRVEGRENVPKEGALIICGNHRSFLDPPFINITLKRRNYFLAKAELYKNPVLAWLGWVFEVIPVKKDDGNDVDAIKKSLKHLKEQDCIVLFPEGTRNGLVRNIKVEDGAAFLAVRTGAKVVPVGISGSMKPFCKLTIKYGKPLDFSNYSKNDKDKLPEITEKIMTEILNLVDDEKEYEENFKKSKKNQRKYPELEK